MDIHTSVSATNNDWGVSLNDSLGGGEDDDRTRFCLGSLVPFASSSSPPLTNSSISLCGISSKPLLHGSPSPMGLEA